MPPAELPAEGEPKSISAAAHEMLLVARGTVARAHHARVELVAHLDCAERGAQRPRMARPVESRAEALDWSVARRIPEPVVEALRADDPVGIEQALRVEHVLYRLEGAGDARSEHRLVEIRSGRCRRRALCEPLCQWTRSNIPRQWNASL
jgi:hypothetical protein